MERFWMVVGVTLLMIGCGSESKGTDPDPGSESGTVDYCERFGWYSDGHCDDICDRPDPDCSMGTNNISPGRPPVPDPGPPTDPPAPSCELDDVGWAREYIAYGDECLSVSIACPSDWTYFDDECGCGCEEAQNSPSCDHLFERGSVEFASEDPDACAALRFTCDTEAGAEYFFDAECGCGCLYPWDVGPVACLDDSTADIDRLGDVEECTLIDFICVEGWTPFYDDCGCGCRLECSDDFECENGYCERGEQAMCIYPNCDDGSEVLCDALPPTCNDTDVAAVINGCYQCLDARSCGPTMGP